MIDKNDIIHMMKEISQTELKEIIASYGFEGLSFEKFIQVEPDTAVYIFHDDKNAKYVLLVADYLGGYDEFNLPHEFAFDYYPDNKVTFDAVRRFSYINNAPKAAVNYIDDDHLKTQATTGDVCMLFGADNLK